MTNHKKFYLNLVAMIFLGAGGIISLIPAAGVAPQIQGALWAALITWLAAAKANGSITE